LFVITGSSLYPSLLKQSFTVYGKNVFNCRKDIDEKKLKNQKENKTVEEKFEVKFEVKNLK
jgi:hypothetical protein